MKWLFLAVVLCCVSLFCSALEGELHQNIILPCSFHPGDDVVIHWNVVDKDKQVVHSYYNGEDRLDEQNINYRGRTSLFLDEIKNGNASLKLMKLQKSDEKTYSCYVGTIAGGKTQATWPLTVQAVIWSEQYRDVTLPCMFSPSDNVVIHWKLHNEPSRYVHSYFEGADQFNNQDKAYTGRTQLFLTELKNGNASLQIRNVHKSDTNTYSCYTSTSKGTKEDLVKLHVADFEHTMEYTPENSALKCCANNIYPSDTATIEWAENGKRTPLPPSKCESHTLKNTSQSFNCRISHSIVASTWRGNWEKKVPKEDSITCECRSCNVNNEFSSKFYLINNTVEVPVASINNFKNSGPNIAADYKNRVHIIPEKYSLNLTNLTMKDNGKYICVIKTIDEMYITVTTVNITTSENPQIRHHWILLGGPLGLNFILILILIFIYKRKTRVKKKNVKKDPL